MLYKTCIDMSSFLGRFKFQGPRPRKAVNFVSGNLTRRRTASRRKISRKRTFKGKSRKGSRKRSVTSLSRRVTALAKGVDASTGRLTHRWFHVESFTVPQGESKLAQMVLNSLPRLEEVLENVPFYDSSTNTIKDINAKSPQFQNAFQFQRTSIKVSMINNQNTSIMLRVGIMVPKNDTNVGPVAAFDAGVADIQLTNNHPLIRFSDAQTLQDLWKFSPGTFKTITLSPGAHYDINMVLPAFEYQVATADADTLTYRRDFQPAVLVYQGIGAIHTDTDIHTEINYSECNVTVTAVVVRKIMYNAGANIQRSVLKNNEVSSFTNQGVQVNQPTSFKQFL